MTEERDLKSKKKPQRKKRKTVSIPEWERPTNPLRYRDVVRSTSPIPTSKTDVTIPAHTPLYLMGYALNDHSEFSHAYDRDGNIHFITLNNLELVKSATPLPEFKVGEYVQCKFNADGQDMKSGLSYQIVKDNGDDYTVIVRGPDQKKSLAYRALLKYI